MRVLLVEDHCRLAESITKGLGRYGFGVDSFPTAAAAINATKVIAYDAIVLDLGLPDRDGIEVDRTFCYLGSHKLQGKVAAPVLILTARDRIDDRVIGLDAGADDYVVKPFAMTELAARLRALLRRPGRPLASILTVGKLRLDVNARQVMTNGTTVRFSAREIDAMEMLMRREGQVVSRENLEGGLYGLSRHVNANSIEVLISRLRRRLSTIDAGCKIHTLHGIGYLLKEDAP